MKQNYAQVPAADGAPVERGVGRLEPERDALYWSLHSLSKALESCGRIYSEDYPDAYATVLDAMNALRSPTLSEALAAAGFTRRPSLRAQVANLEAGIRELVAASGAPTMGPNDRSNGRW